jgi:hypothetical protein
VPELAEVAQAVEPAQVAEPGAVVASAQGAQARFQAGAEARRLAARAAVQGLVRARERGVDAGVPEEQGVQLGREAARLAAAQQRDAGDLLVELGL